MIFQRINRNSPEKVFIVVMNSWSTASLTAGQVVQWDLADADGVGVTLPTVRATGGGLTTAGIAAETILPGAFGLMQVYGYNGGVRARAATGGTPVVAPGRPLVVNAAGSLFCLESISTASNAITAFPIGFALGSTTGWTTASVKAFIKAM